MRLLGPNTIGLVNVTDGIALSASAALQIDVLVPGAVALVSQSGEILGSLLSRAAAQGIGFSKLIATGNESDIDVSDLIHYLVDDPATEGDRALSGGSAQAGAVSAGGVAGRASWRADRGVQGRAIGVRCSVGKFAYRCAGGIGRRLRCPVQAVRHHQGPAILGSARYPARAELRASIERPPRRHCHVDGRSG